MINLRKRLLKNQTQMNSNRVQAHSDKNSSKKHRFNRSKKVNRFNLRKEDKSSKRKVL